jgi:hypothetical protein
LLDPGYWKHRKSVPLKKPPYSCPNQSQSNKPEDQLKDELGDFERQDQDQETHYNHRCGGSVGRNTRFHAPHAGELCEVSNRAAAVGFINGFSSAAGISLAAELALGRKSSSALLTRSYFGLRAFLAFPREAWLGKAAASTAGTFRTTLAAKGFSLMGIAFAGPLILNHCTTRARRLRG